MDKFKNDARTALVERICTTVKVSCYELGLSDAVAYVLLHDIIVAAGVVQKKPSYNRESFNPNSIEDDDN